MGQSNAGHRQGSFSNGVSGSSNQAHSFFFIGLHQNCAL